jgi:hypothetical protein
LIMLERPRSKTSALWFLVAHPVPGTDIAIT